MSHHHFASQIFCMLIAVFFMVSPLMSDSPIDTVRLMPLGDSITQGYRGKDCYRRFLWHRLQHKGMNVDFVGSLPTNYPIGQPLHPDFDMDHEGHWGWRADEILAVINTWMKKNTPDIVLVHLGTNDIFQGQKNAETINELEQIITILRQYNPEVKILLAQLIPVAGKSGQEKIAAFNALLPGLAAKVATAHSPVIIVDQFTGFNAHADTYDGIHPNESGSRKMADRWYQALMFFLKTPSGLVQ